MQTPITRLQTVYTLHNATKQTMTKQTNIQTMTKQTNSQTITKQKKQTMTEQANKQAMMKQTNKQSNSGLTFLKLLTIPAVDVVQDVGALQEEHVNPRLGIHLKQVKHTAIPG